MNYALFELSDPTEIINELEKECKDKFEKYNRLVRYHITFGYGMVELLKKLNHKFNELCNELHYTDVLFDELFDILKKHFNSSDENYEQIHDLIITCYKYFGNSEYREARIKYGKLKAEINEVSNIIQRNQSTYDKSKNLKCISYFKDSIRAQLKSKLKINGIDNDYEFAWRLYKLTYGKYVGYGENCVKPTEIDVYLNSRGTIYSDFIKYCTDNNLTPDQAVKIIMEVK